MHISAIQGPRLQEGLVATQNPTNITSCEQPAPCISNHSLEDENRKVCLRDP